MGGVTEDCTVASIPLKLCPFAGAVADLQGATGNFSVLEVNAQFQGIPRKDIAHDR